MDKKYEAVVVGVSSGGWQALNRIIPAIPGDFPIPVAIVQHMAPGSDNYLSKVLNEKSALRVKEADEKEALQVGTVYIAPPNYHLLIEPDRTLGLSTCEPVNYARPSIDVLFETAVDVFGPSLIGILLTGASNDGSRGLQKIKMEGGVTIAQNPQSAEAPIMPQSAIDLNVVDHITDLDNLVKLLVEHTCRTK